jgi:glyoxylase-like metal-dependent hydrolase (beta-lactamase superfamily II)
MVMVSILKDIPIDGVKIIPCRIAVGQRGVVKSFLLAGDAHRVILVDTGASDADADIIMDAIKDMGHRHEDLELCVLTHRHGDHTGGLKKLKKTLKFEVMAHELDMPAIHSQTGYEVEHIVRGGERLADCGGIHIIHTPGHTAGHISLHLPRIKTMIAGDAIVSAGEHLMVSPTYLSSDPGEAQQSVRRLIEMNLDLETLLVGHGDDVYFGAKNNMARIFAGPRE